MHVVFVSWRDLADPSAGGSEVLIDRLASGLQTRGHEVTLVAGGTAGMRPYTVVSSGGRLSQYVRAPYAIRRGLADADVVVDVENGVPFFSPMWWRGPTVCLVHHVHQEQWHQHYRAPVAAAGAFAERIGLTRAHRGSIFVAVSPSTAKELEALGVDASRIRVVYQGIEVPATATVDRPGEPTFLALGRLVVHKRMSLLLSMWANVREATGGQLVIAGDGPLLAALEATAGPDVQLLGFVDDATKDRLLSSARLLVHPAQQEGWGIAIMEAAARATPALAFDVNGVRDAIQDGRTGVLAASQAEFERAWIELAADEERRGALGRAARARAEGFSWESCVAAVESVLEEAVTAGRPHRRAREEPGPGLPVSPTLEQAIAPASLGEKPSPDGWGVEPGPAEPVSPAVEQEATSPGPGDELPPDAWEAGPGDPLAAPAEPAETETDADTEPAPSPGPHRPGWQTPVVPADVPRRHTATSELGPGGDETAPSVETLAAPEVQPSPRMAARTRSAPDRRRRSRWWIVAAAAVAITVIAAAVALTGVLGDDAPDTTLFIDRFDGAEHWIEDGTTPIWDQQTGAWLVTEGSVRVSRGTDRISLATIDRNIGDGIISLSMGTTNRAGLAFRVRDAENFWSLTSASDFGTWNLSQVRDGRSVFITNIGPTPLDDMEVAVELDGRTITVLVYGQIVLGLDDGYLADEDDAGLVTFGDEARLLATFDRFSATVVLAE